MMSKSFFDTLRTLRKGKTIGELDEAIGELVEKVKHTGRPGELVLKIKVKPLGKGDVDQINIEDDVVMKLPKFERGVTMFFVDDDNNLVRTDPRQGEIPGLRPVEERKAAS